MRLLSIEGPVYPLMVRLWDLVKLNFLWLVFSLPIVTIGASTVAAHRLPRCPASACGVWTVEVLEARIAYLQPQPASHFPQGLATESRHLQQPFTTRHSQVGVTHEWNCRPALPFEQITRSPAEIVECLGSAALQALSRRDDLPDALDTQAVIGRDVLCRLAGPAGAHDPRVPRRFREGAAVADVRPCPG